MEKVRIAAPGSLFDALIIEGTPYACGHVVAGIGARLEGNKSGFVLSWEDFERAYLALKTERSTLAFAEAEAHQRAECEIPALPNGVSEEPK